MRERSRPVLDEIRAESIESWNDALYRGLVWAIVHLTRSDLEKLGTEYRDKKVREVSDQAKEAEEIIMKSLSLLLSNLNQPRGFWIELTLKTKELMKDILPAMQYLYSLRHGEGKWATLNALFNSDIDEPYVLEFIFNRDTSGKYFIESMNLKGLKTEKRDS